VRPTQWLHDHLLTTARTRHPHSGARNFGLRDATVQSSTFGCGRTLAVRPATVLAMSARHGLSRSHGQPLI
jgi:hypothetical protein